MSCARKTARNNIYSFQWRHPSTTFHFSYVALIDYLWKMKYCRQQNNGLLIVPTSKSYQMPALWLYMAAPCRPEKEINREWKSMCTLLLTNCFASLSESQPEPIFEQVKVDFYSLLNTFLSRRLFFATAAQE